MCMACAQVRLTDQPRVELGQLAHQICPKAVELCGINGRETKIDIDALEPTASIRLDMHVRSLIAKLRQAAVPAAGAGAAGPSHV